MACNFEHTWSIMNVPFVTRHSPAAVASCSTVGVMIRVAGRSTNSTLSGSTVVPTALVNVTPKFNVTSRFLMLHTLTSAYHTTSHSCSGSFSSSAKHDCVSCSCCFSWSMAAVDVSSAHTDRAWLSSNCSNIRDRLSFIRFETNRDFRSLIYSLRVLLF